MVVTALAVFGAVMGVLMISLLLAAAVFIGLDEYRARRNRRSPEFELERLIREEREAGRL